MGNNVILQTAKNKRDDEFYTTYETIEKELCHYENHFIEKIVFCNCDDPFESNFCKYFLINFNKLKLRKLICTSYYSSKIAKNHLKTKTKKNKGYILEVEEVPCSLENDNEILKFIEENNKIRMLEGNGDFRSKECLAYLNECDIVVTNPPFSLFRELFLEIMSREKKFLLIGNQNALTYKEIFPYIIKNKVWTGYQFGEMKFKVPKDTAPRKTRYWVDETGQKWRSLGNAMWLTNLDIDRRHKTLELNKKFDSKLYKKYDSFDAIHIPSVKDIPVDYDGIMGVPITIIDKYNSAQFEIIGEANHGSDNEYDLFKPTIEGKEIFKRILIRRRW